MHKIKANDFRLVSKTLSGEKKKIRWTKKLGRKNQAQEKSDSAIDFSQKNQMEKIRLRKKLDGAIDFPYI